MGDAPLIAEDALLASAHEELELPKVLDIVSRYCRTSRGAEVVRELRPVYDAEDLRSTLACVQEMVNLIGGGLKIPLPGVDDVRNLLHRARIAGNYLSAPDILLVHEVLTTSRVISTFFAEQQHLAPRLFDRSAALVADRVLEKHITDVIDDTAAVRDTASRELQEIRREIHTLSARLRSRLQRILKQYGEEELLQEEFVTQRDGRFVVPLRVGNKRMVDGIIHGMSASGQTVFMEPAETYEMNNELSILRSREQREIIRLLSLLTAEIGAVSAQIEEAYDVLTWIDTILARASYALDYGGLLPVICDEELVELSDVRHPLLEHQSKERRRSQGAGFTVVPLSVTLDHATRGVLISGPNAGGKTVAMKTIGLSLTMAMTGIFPLGQCTTSIKRVFTAIGDHQSIDSNLSTFSSQIIRLRDVLSYCDRHALVLIDEICAGTDPAEGGALAAGILDSLLERSASFVVTTHQSSLKQYALTRPSITNASLAFDEEHLQPTFTFLFGVPGNSYAFDLARSVGLPSVVLERAGTYLGERHGELEQSITAMQQFKRDAERLKTEAAQERAQAAQLKSEYERRLAEVTQKRSTAVRDAREQAAELLRDANALIERTIREIREESKSAKEVKESFATQRDALLKAVPVADEPSQVSEAGTQEIAVGDAVVVTGTSSAGTVLAIDAKRQDATIDVNGIKFRVKVSQLTRTSQGKTPGTSSARSSAQPFAQSSTRRDTMHVVPDASMSLDMRGMRVDECVRALEQFLDAAIVRRLPFGTIIHGKGSGALRKVVHDYLADHHGVSSYRLGRIEEGGDGVTIVEF